MTTALAHPNIALIKYWGKQDTTDNLPATPSIAITLSGLTTETVVRDAAADRFVLDGVEVDDRKIARFLADLRTKFDIPPLEIVSSNDFPSSAGLASSASGLAALTTAIDAHCALGLTAAQRSGWARRGSASAARSIFGGFVTLEAPTWTARQLLAEDEWPMSVVVAVTDTGAKPVNSTQGMTISRNTSPYYRAWEDSTPRDFERAAVAVANKDFDTLAPIAEHSSMKMHALMISSLPPLLYWNAASVACLNAVTQLRAAGVPVFATMDAGPQVKAVCLPDAAETVASTLSAQPGVVRIIQSGLGAGARTVAG